MAAEIQRLCPEFDLHFYDAAAPIVTLESVDMDSAYFRQPATTRARPDYVNCPMDQDGVHRFRAGAAQRKGSAHPRL